MNIETLPAKAKVIFAMASLLGYDFDKANTAYNAGVTVEDIEQYAGLPLEWIISLVGSN